MAAAVRVSVRRCFTPCCRARWQTVLENTTNISPVFSSRPIFDHQRAQKIQPMRYLSQ